jgi:hypothetical protein
MNNMDSFLDIIILFAGAYLIYSAALMKVKGEVASGFLGKDVDWKHVSEENKKAYIKIMIPANIIMGIMMIIMGLVFMFGNRIGLNGTHISILIGIALLICVAYGAVIMNYQSKYLK